MTTPGGGVWRERLPIALVTAPRALRGFSITMAVLLLRDVLPMLVRI